MNILNFLRREQNGELKSMVSCYDHRSTKTLNKNSLDMLRVGDTRAGLCTGFVARCTRWSGGSNWIWPSDNGFIGVAHAMTKLLLKNTNV
jgi:hypothetical protein